MNDVYAILMTIANFLKAHTMAGGDIGSIGYWITLILTIGIAIKVAGKVGS